MSASREFRRALSMLLLGDSPGGNYTDQAMQIAVRNASEHRYGLYHIDVLHDDWCALLTKGMPCNCNPEVRERA